MAARAFSAGALVGIGGYLSMKQIIHQRTQDSIVRLEKMRLTVNPPPKQASKTSVPSYAVEHEYYTKLREGWNSGLFHVRDTLLDLFDAKK